MTLKEKSSARKRLAIENLVKNGEYSPEYGLQLCENYHDRGLLTDIDYEELADFLENLLNQPIEISDEDTMEEIEKIEETPTDILL